MSEQVEKDWTEDPVGNYARVAAERGISDESMAVHLDGVDPNLAARFRKERGVSGPPEGRSANGPQQTADADAGKPAKVDDVLAEVGEDKGKAQAALDAELSRGDDARKSLVAKLQAIVD